MVVNKSVTCRLSIPSVGRVKLFALKMSTDCQPFGTSGQHVFALSLADCECSVMAQVCAKRGRGHSGVGVNVYMYAEQSLCDATVTLREDGDAWILLSPATVLSFASIPATTLNVFSFEVNKCRSPGRLGY